MLAAEAATLPDPVASAVEGFFGENEAWLCGVFEAGDDAGARGSCGGPEAQARLFLAVLEGAMISARGRRDRGRFDTIVAAFPSGIESV